MLFNKRKKLKKPLDKSSKVCYNLTVKRKNKENRKGDKKMRFVGYVVNGKFFGCGQRKEAYEYAKKIGAKVQLRPYKI